MNMDLFELNLDDNSCSEQKEVFLVEKYIDSLNITNTLYRISLDINHGLSVEECVNPNAIFDNKFVEFTESKFVNDALDYYNNYARHNYSDLCDTVLAYTILSIYQRLTHKSCVSAREAIIVYNAIYRLFIDCNIISAPFIKKVDLPREKPDLNNYEQFFTDCELVDSIQKSVAVNSTDMTCLIAKDKFNYYSMYTLDLSRIDLTKYKVFSSLENRRDFAYLCLLEFCNEMGILID